jgi:rubredoxin
MSVVQFQKWQCYFCGYFYDEALGDPEHGVAAGTAWADVPEDWFCPDCGAGKSDFAMIEAEG